MPYDTLFIMAKKFKAEIAAMMSGISIATLNRWEKHKLLPAPKREDNGYRYYTEKDVKHIKDFAVINKSKKKV